jgi:hypothetical protein
MKKLALLCMLPLLLCACDNNKVDVIINNNYLDPTPFDVSTLNGKTFYIRNGDESRVFGHDLPFVYEFPSYITTHSTFSYFEYLTVEDSKLYFSWLTTDYNDHQITYIEKKDEIDLTPINGRYYSTYAWGEVVFSEDLIFWGDGSCFVTLEYIEANNIPIHSFEDEIDKWIISTAEDTWPNFFKESVPSEEFIENKQATLPEKMVLSEDPEVEVKLSYALSSGMESYYSINGYELSALREDVISEVYLDVTFEYKNISFTSSFNRHW